MASFFPSQPLIQVFARNRYDNDEDEKEILVLSESGLQKWLGVKNEETDAMCYVVDVKAMTRSAFVDNVWVSHNFLFSPLRCHSKNVDYFVSHPEGHVLACISLVIQQNVVQLQQVGISLGWDLVA